MARGSGLILWGIVAEAFLVANKRPLAEKKIKGFNTESTEDGAQRMRGIGLIAAEEIRGGEAVR
jgi:hypothetical protein